MKKFLAIVAIAGTMVACNNEGENSTAADSTNLTTPVTVDSTTVTNSTVDSTASQPLVDTTTTGTTGNTTTTDTTQK